VSVIEGLPSKFELDQKVRVTKAGVISFVRMRGYKNNVR